jgi:hypothetical protein
VPRIRPSPNLRFFCAASDEKQTLIRVGEMQFAERDLKARDFIRVQAQIRGG